MQRKVSLIAFLGLTIFLFVLPSSAQSNLSESYDNLFLLLTIVSAFVLLLVVALWAYFIKEYAEGNEETDRTPITHETSRKLEVGWTAVAIFIVIILMFVSYPVLFSETNLAETEPTGTEIIVQGTGGWAWKYILPNGTVLNETIAENGDRITDIKLNVGEEYTFIFWNRATFIHSYYVDALNIKMDVMPGQNNTYTFTIEESVEDGTRFPVLCTEFCGQYHSQMKGDIIAVTDGSGA